MGGLTVVKGGVFVGAAPSFPRNAPLTPNVPANLLTSRTREDTPDIAVLAISCETPERDGRRVPLAHYAFLAKTSFRDLPYGQKLLLSPCSQASRSPGLPRSQSDLIFMVTSRKSRRRSSGPGRPQYQ